MRRRLQIYTLLCGLLILLASGGLPLTGHQLHAAPLPAPLLVVMNDAAPNPFGRYLAEILRAEGLSSFEIIQLSALTSADMSGRAAVILAETPLTATQAALLTGFVSGGGRLLALRPDAQIAPLFGIAPLGTSQTDGYLRIDTTSAPGQGLSGSTLQIHGQSDRYALTSGTALALLYSSATAATSNPAVVTASYGSGKTAAFSYDLVRNVVLTRQGNPANSGVDVDGDGTIRTIDLFQGSGGGQPWVDRDRVGLPQADIQQRLFARIVLALAADSLPLPRLWYFSGTSKTVIVPTGDAHANPLSYYTNEINSLTAHGGKITLYLSKGGGIETADAQVQAWRAQGHSFGIHPYALKPDDYPTPITNLQEGYDSYSGSDGSAGWWTSRFSSPKSRTARNHQVAWQGWIDAAAIEVAHGIGLDANFYSWGNWLKRSDGSWPHGYVNGSGQPMKFVTSAGTVLPIYQQVTALVDEQLFSLYGGYGEGLNAAQALAISKQLIDASQAGDYAALMTQFHVDYYGFGDPQTWAEGTLDYANSLAVPVWNADEWLSFTETRNAASYSNIAWDSGSGQLSFTLTSPANPNSLTTMLPLTYNGQPLISVTVNGTPQSYNTQTINGIALAFVSTATGSQTIGARYQVPPTATPTNTLTNTPTNTPTRTPTATLTNTPTATPTRTPTNTSTPTPTQTSTPTPTSTPTGTGDPTWSPVPTSIPTSTGNPTASPPPTVTPTPTRTGRLTRTIYLPVIAR